MDPIFLSRVNAIGHQMAAEAGEHPDAPISSGSSSMPALPYDYASQQMIEKIKGRLEDASSCYDYPVFASSWGSPDAHPFGWPNYLLLMIDPSSEINSSVITQADNSPGIGPSTVPVIIPVNLRESVKYALVQGIDGYTEDGQSLVTGYPLILKINSYAESTGWPVCTAINGRKQNASDENCMINAIPKGSMLVLLTDKPVFQSEEVAKLAAANQFVVLDCDCPALAPDAKCGDVYSRSYGFDVIDKDSVTHHMSRIIGLFIKFYSFDEKLRAVLGIPDARVKAIDGSDEIYRVFCLNSLDFLDFNLIEYGIEKFYALLLNDYTVGSGTSAKTYKKGDFLFIDCSDSDSVHIIKVPFDIFFK